MDGARYLVEALVLEGRSVGELAAAHGVHRSWIYKLLARYRDGGYQALEPRSRRPRSCKHETPPEIVGAIVALRLELESHGHDAGAETIAYHLAGTYKDVPSLSTIWRILRREGLVVAERQKRPRSSLIRAAQRSSGLPVARAAGRRCVALTVAPDVRRLRVRLK